MQKYYNFPNYKNFGEEKLSPSIVKRTIVDCSTNNGKSVVEQVFLRKNLTAIVNLIQDFKFRITNISKSIGMFKGKQSVVFFNFYMLFLLLGEI